MCGYNATKISCCNSPGLPRWLRAIGCWVRAGRFFSVSSGPPPARGRAERVGLFLNCGRSPPRWSFGHRPRGSGQRREVAAVGCTMPDPRHAEPKSALPRRAGASAADGRAQGQPPRDPRGGPHRHDFAFCGGVAPGGQNCPSPARTATSGAVWGRGRAARLTRPGPARRNRCWGADAAARGACGRGADDRRRLDDARSGTAHAGGVFPRHVTCRATRNLASASDS